MTAILDEYAKRCAQGNGAWRDARYPQMVPAPSAAMAAEAVAADPRDVLELREQSASLRAALAALTPDERRAIEMTFFAGLTRAAAPKCYCEARNGPSRF